MTTKTFYEWDIETWVGEDIEDHHHEDVISRLPSLEANQKLVLVRDTFVHESLELRLWAYVVDGKLPEFFSDIGAYGYEETGYKVPKRFHAELAKSEFGQ